LEASVESASVRETKCVAVCGVLCVAVCVALCGRGWQCFAVCLCARWKGMEWLWLVGSKKL